MLRNLKYKFADLAYNARIGATRFSALQASITIGAVSAASSYWYAVANTGNRSAAYLCGAITAGTTAFSAIVGDKLSDNFYNKAKLMTVSGAFLGALGGGAITHYSMHELANEDKMDRLLPASQSRPNVKKPERLHLATGFNDKSPPQQHFAFGNTMYDPTTNTVTVKSPELSLG